VSTNTAPTISVTGVAGGASYNKGSVPAATCQVTDAQDGNSSFAATLSAITGPYASDGIGSQTASCSYTDGGGLMARSSETYSIVDSSAPVIVPTLTGTLGTNGWYTSDVTLTWSVSDPDSPSSLQKTGCVDQNITADQQATSYTCDATSAGGSTQAATVTIKRDATAPEVNPANVTDPAWRNTNLSQTFSASDTGSGLATAADASFTLTASAESADASTPTVATKTVTDLAGNSTTRTVSAKIDLTSPVILGGDVNNTTWRNTSLSESFTASDALSGLAIPGDAGFTLTASLESANASTPTVVSKTVTDVVGNSTTRTVSALIDLTKPTNVQFVNGPAAGGVYFPTTVPANGTCTADDGLSGLASCSVTGHSTSAGHPHADRHGNGQGRERRDCDPLVPGPHPHPHRVLQPRRHGRRREHGQGRVDGAAQVQHRRRGRPADLHLPGQQLHHEQELLPRRLGRRRDRGRHNGADDAALRRDLLVSSSRTGRRPRRRALASQ
jgi:hypothetical protein